MLTNWPSHAGVCWSTVVIKSPRYTGGDYVLYRFAQRRRRRILNNILNFFHFWPKNGPIATKQKSNISIELWASNVTIGFDLGHVLGLEFSRSNMEFAISQPEMVRLPRNEKYTYWLNSRPQIWPSSLTLAMTLAMTLTLIFSRSNM